MFNIEFLHVIRRHEIAALRPYFPPNARVLELGGGTGYQAKLLSEQGLEVYSIDLPTSSYRAHQVHQVIPYDGRHFPFADQSFDVVFSSNLLEHVADLAMLHRESARVLKPEGYAIHVVPTSAWRLWTIFAHYIEMAQRIATELARCGWRSPLSARHNIVGIVRHHALVPRHGESGNALTELVTFSAAHWRRHFRAHRLRVVMQRPMGLFYTGHMLLGARIPLSARQTLSRLAGSACMLWIVRFPERRDAGEADQEPSP